ncbi:MAG: methionyl-tRNA formyltransferase [Phycisphaerales bacterium]|nr:methionyl-tRNA formyltransferase [Phycisphaerales bacterium]
MNIVLMGSVSSSGHALNAFINSGVELAGVLGVDESQSARIGDYHSLRGLAVDAGIDFHPFVRVDEPAVEAFLRSHPADQMWVIGLSQLVPSRLTALASAGAVGFHPTMLPEGRGRAPVAWTILLGARAAVSLFFLTDEPDAGDIIAQREVPVLPDDYSEDLIARTNDVLEQVIADLAPSIKAGRVPRTPQDHSRATYYSKRTPADGRIDWSQPVDTVYRLIRAAGRPYPGAFTHWNGRKLTICRARPLPGPIDGRPGRVLSSDAAGVIVSTADGRIQLTEWTLDDAPSAPPGIPAGDALS